MARDGNQGEEVMPRDEGGIPEGDSGAPGENAEIKTRLNGRAGPPPGGKIREKS